MTLDERHQQIIRVLNERTRASVAELADITGASTMTVRRDLELLESQGALRRVHGAAVSTMLSGEEAPYAIRAMTDTGVKDKLASAVGEVLVDGETVVLDSGTSATAAARALGHRRLTVTPLSLHAVQELIQHDHIQLLMTGGQIRPGELSFYGQLTVQGFADLRYDTFIMGCCGIDADGGVSAHLLEDVYVKRAAMQSAQRTVVVASADKIGRVTFGRICSLEDIDLIVTNAENDAQHLEALRRAGAQVLHV